MRPNWVSFFPNSLVIGGGNHINDLRTSCDNCFHTNLFKWRTFAESVPATKLGITYSNKKSWQSLFKVQVSVYINFFSNVCNCPFVSWVYNEYNHDTSFTVTFTHTLFLSQIRTLAFTHSLCFSISHTHSCIHTLSISLWLICILAYAHTHTHTLTHSCKVVRFLTWGGESIFDFLASQQK